MADYERTFATNLRRLRKAAGLTQAELGNAIGYSEKTVSKWECAAGIPDVEGLFALAKILCVSLEALFADDSEVYYLGIDGGGTKTTFLLTDAEGKTLRKHIADCSNPADIGIEACTQLLKNGIQTVCQDIPLTNVVVFAGIAGAMIARKQLDDFFRTLPLRKFACDSDYANLVQAALGDGDGVAVILGTGISVWTIKDKERFRTGGWGYLVNEGGCAFDIGQDALKAYYATVDGVRSPGILTESIASLYANDPTALLSQVYAGGKKWIASLAPIVFKAALQGDGDAVAIINRNMAVAAKLIETAAVRLTTPQVKVVIAGGLTNQPQLIDMLKCWMQTPERYDLSILDTEPVTGAVALAMKLLTQN